MIKKKFSKIEWYKQGAAVRPLYIGYPWKGCIGFTIRGKRVPMSYLPFGVYLKEDVFDVYFPRHRLRQIGEYYWKQEQRRPGFIQSLRQNWEKKEVAQLQFWIQKIYSLDLKALGNPELVKIFKQFSQVYTRFWKEAIFLDAFDVMSEIILEQAIKRTGRTILANDLAVLTSPSELSWLQQERQELLTYAALSAAKQEKMLRRHAERWHWIYNDYAIIRNLDWKFFKRELRKITRTDARNERNVLAAVGRIKQQKDRIARRLKLSRDFMNTIRFLTTLAKWRDWRKSFNQMANGAIFQFVKVLEKRTGWTQEEIEYLWWDEIPHIFEFGARGRTLTQRRKEGFFAIGDPSKMENVFLDREARVLQDFMVRLLGTRKELKGRPAFHGKVQGVVRIVLTQQEFHKIKKGDILVAPNTRPEYVPIMKIAGAIVSEEGGLTCHTAIVSRELKIPAIVGVQGAIAALKDGDQVEVDAFKGTVRKI